MPGSDPGWTQGGLPGAASEWLQSFKGRFEATFPVGVEQGQGVPGATRAGHLVRGQKALVKANLSWKTPAICPEASKGLSLWH